MQILPFEQFCIYKFDQQQVIMMHKKSKQLYQYFEIPNIKKFISKAGHKQIQHQNLQKAIILSTQTGIIYKKGVSTLKKQISKRLTMTKKLYFQQQELINTFVPVLKCLQHLHSKSLIHQQISPDSIIFTQQGQVLLRDWTKTITDNLYYENKKRQSPNKNEDIIALGNIIFEAAFLTQYLTIQKQNTTVEIVLKNNLEKYSRGFVLAIYVMCKNASKYFTSLEKLINNDVQYIDSCQQLCNLYKRLKGQKQTKAIHSPSILNYKNLDIFIGKTPLHNTTKKSMKNQDVQNKRITIEQFRKKNTERFAKIGQKNLDGTRKVDMVLKKTSNLKFNVSQNPEKPQNGGNSDILKFSSPLKRLRVFSKKRN